MVATLYCMGEIRARLAAHTHSNKQAYLLVKVSIRSTAKPHIAYLHLLTLRVLAYLSKLVTQSSQHNKIATRSRQDYGKTAPHQLLTNDDIG